MNKIKKYRNGKTELVGHYALNLYIFFWNFILLNYLLTIKNYEKKNNE